MTPEKRAKLEKQVRNLIARIFEISCDGGPNAWETCDEEAKKRIDRAAKEIREIVCKGLREEVTQ